VLFILCQEKNGLSNNLTNCIKMTDDNEGIEYITDKKIVDHQTNVEQGGKISTITPIIIM
jgi:hypothetical protein